MWNPRGLGAGIMFKTLRFLTKRSSAYIRSSSIRRSVSRDHSLWTGRHHCEPILANKFQWPNSDRRFKRTKKKDNNDDDDNSDDELELDDSSQLIKFRTSTMRMDSVIKYALGKSRNKIEVAFYESRIRVNGEKVPKKSHTLVVGDEVDLIKGFSPNNPDFLLVSRIEVLSVKLDGDELETKLKKYRNLLINNYSNKWKSSTE